MRLRLEFTKEEELRFVSHLDLMKTFERAMRRANVPLAFSEGFNPHPKMAFASALAVGVTSAREYMDIETVQDVSTENIKNDLNNALPKGLHITTVMTVAKSLPALMASVNRALYEVTISVVEPVSSEELLMAIKKIMDLPELIVLRSTKKGPRPKDIRPGIDQISGQVLEPKVSLKMLLHAGGELNIRPEDVVQALKEFGQLAMDIEYMQIHKAGLYIARDQELYSPLDEAVL